MLNAQISFTQQIKEELTLIPFEGDVVKAILSAYIKLSGRISIHDQKMVIILETENAKVAKFIYLLTQKRYNVSPTFSFRKKMRFEKKISYIIQIQEKVSMILDDLELDLFDDNPTKSFLRKDEMIRGYFVGIFLSSGSCNNPNSSNYHLEIATQDEALANYLLKLLDRNKNVRFGAKITQRKNQYVIYIKKSDQIVNFMAYIGAVNSCLIFEEIRVERDFVNNDNRLQICADANYKKTTDSALRQLEDIAIIDEKLGINNLTNKKMKILCYLRRENEDYSMGELAELLSEEIGSKVSKSNVNHLFRAIKELAARYKGDSHES